MATPEEMRVTTDHLREMASKHQQIAADVAAGAQATDGAFPLVSATHGPVCAATIAALASATASRSVATTTMKGISEMLGGLLQEGAAKYDTTDQTESGKLNSQMHQR